MATTLFDAKPYDPGKDRRRRNLIVGVVVVVVLIAGLLWWFRYWPYERKVDQFFTALQTSDFERAYGIWMNDPNWKQHPEKYARYPFKEFYLDWGPSGEWGVIKTHKVDTAVAPRGSSTGVIVVTTVNERAEQACVWVEKRDKTLSFPPVKAVTCR